MCLVREGCTVRTYFTYSLTHTRVDSVTQLLTPGQVDRCLVVLLLSSREGKKWGRRKEGKGKTRARRGKKVWWCEGKGGGTTMWLLGFP